MLWSHDLDQKEMGMVSRMGMSVRVYLAKHLPLLEPICKQSFHNKLS